MTNEIIKKLTSGILSGLGIGIGLAIVAYLTIGLLVGKMYEETATATNEMYTNNSPFKKYGPESGLEIVSHDTRKIANGIAVLAQLKNNGESTWSSISVEVELLDKKGKFVEECSTYVRGSMKPGDSENIRIKCGGCKNNPLPPYHTYTIKIKDASSY